ncbi:hypothetical protein PDE_09385 [Penicillium oxalicum 114-2]|uniref:Transcription factor domain-containing protein n=1 Tax=Penicillium oxalicum (strain 114-2 / CGMCC 5302) TaxID=933388 RepID=S8A008_PENO1|nr:hypothetical protein PDE_09385 [Penicillium oxalicum 114-2]
MTIGAQYRFEHRNAEKLFHASKTVLYERMSRDSRIGGYAAPLNNSQYSVDAQAPIGTSINRSRHMEVIRSLLLLMSYATWERAGLVQEAFQIQAQLVQHIRDAGLTEPYSDPRTMSDCIAYNVYPSLRSSEIHMRLPCSTKEWTANNAVEWEAAQRDRGPQQLFFQDALTLLLQKSRSAVPLEPIPAPLGNYMLLHGLLQRIHIVSELSLPNGNHTNTLPTEELNKIDKWLFTLADAAPDQALSENESRILRWTQCIVEEAFSSVDLEDESEAPPNLEPAALGMAVLRLWARLFKRNTQWPFINVLGQSLEQYMAMI